MRRNRFGRTDIRGAGQAATLVDEAPSLSDLFRAQLFWLTKEPVKTGASFGIKFGTAIAKVAVRAIESVVNLDTHSDTQIEFGRAISRTLLYGGARSCLSQLSDMTLPWPGSCCSTVSRWSAAACQIFRGFRDQRRSRVGRATNVRRVESVVTRAEREDRGAVIWLTGLSGAGKSTFAQRADRFAVLERI